MELKINQQQLNQTVDQLFEAFDDANSGREHIFQTQIENPFNIDSIGKF